MLSLPSPVVLGFLLAQVARDELTIAGARLEFGAGHLGRLVARALLEVL